MKTYDFTLDDALLLDAIRGKKIGFVVDGEISITLHPVNKGVLIPIKEYYHLKQTASYEQQKIFIDIENSNY